MLVSVLDIVSFVFWSLFGAVGLLVELLLWT